MTDIDRIVAVAKRLGEVRAEADQLEAELRQLAGAPSKPQAELKLVKTRKVKHRRKRNYTDSKLGKTFDALKTFPGEQVTSKQVADLLGMDAHSAYKHLWRLSKTRKDVFRTAPNTFTYRASA